MIDALNSHEATNTKKRREEANSGLEGEFEKKVDFAEGRYSNGDLSKESATMLEL